MQPSPANGGDADLASLVVETTPASPMKQKHKIKHIRNRIKGGFTKGCLRKWLPGRRKGGFYKGGVEKTASRLPKGLVVHRGGVVNTSEPDDAVCFT